MITKQYFENMTQTTMCRRKMQTGNWASERPRCIRMGSLARNNDKTGKGALSGV